ncbi:MAG: molybdenum cofactor guanylyltransferase [Limnothrix sp. BL-A-16]|jgi:molybdopterin-guanine dinucleotide biosynthesis protein A
MIQAAILAGGQSRRMGRDKVLLPWNGQPMLHRVCEVAISVTERRPIIFSPWPERYQTHPATAALPVDWWQESVADRGPLLAFSELLDRAARDLTDINWVWLLACDLPCLDGPVCRSWLDRRHALSSKQVALVPRTDRGWEPLCGLYRPAIAPQLRTFIDQGGRSFQAWLDQLATEQRAIYLPLTTLEAATLRNCNSPQDLQDFLRHRAPASENPDN